MTREEIIRNLKYTIKKYEDKPVNTFDTNIPVMCKDILEYLEQESKSPCDMCPAQATKRFKEKVENGYFRDRKYI